MSAKESRVFTINLPWRRSTSLPSRQLPHSVHTQSNW